VGLVLMGFQTVHKSGTKKNPGFSAENGIKGILDRMKGWFGDSL
jgi:hypothetical protein